MKMISAASTYLLLLLSLLITASGFAQQGTSSAQAALPASSSLLHPAEDWNSPVLDEKSLQPMSYATIGKKEEPDFTRELLRVQWRAGDPIDLFVVLPHGVVKPPVILYLYGYPADTERFYDDGWCKRATRHGFAAVGFVSALTGQRFSNRPFKEWFVSDLQEALGESAHDVQMILNYLARRGDLADGPVGMFGQGSGGAIGILAAAVDPRIGALDVLDPWGDWPDWLKSSPLVPNEERAAYLEPEFLKRVANLDPVLYLPRFANGKLRLEQVTAELITPPAAKDKLDAAAPRKDQVVIYADERAHLAAYRLQGLTGWLEEQVRPRPAGAPDTATPSTSPAPAHP